MYTIDYLDENDFKKKERSLRKYNMLACKKLVFTYYPKLLEGNSLGKLVKRDEKAKSQNYELQLPADKLFEKVHGQIILHYTIYTDKKVIVLTNITPEEIFGARDELATYKGVMVSKTNPEKDMFKINLLTMLDKQALLV